MNSEIERIKERLSERMKHYLDEFKKAQINKEYESVTYFGHRLNALNEVFVIIKEEQSGIRFVKSSLTQKDIDSRIS